MHYSLYLLIGFKTVLSDEGFCTSYFTLFLCLLTKKRSRIKAITVRSIIKMTTPTMAP